MADDTPELTEEAVARKWRHRRRMAYMALAGLLMVPVILVALGLAGRLGPLADFTGVIVTVVSVLGSLVGAYMGLATWHERGR